MSQMMTLEIPFKSEDDIKMVLDHFGLRYEEAADGVEIRGYRGVVGRMKGQIVVRSEMFNGMADMGFIKQEDGSWKIHCESADHSHLTQMQNAYLYLKVEAGVKRRRQKMTIVKGRVPQKLERHGSRDEELQISVEV